MAAKLARMRPSPRAFKSSTRLRLGTNFMDNGLAAVSGRLFPTLMIITQESDK
jgi:hypothetical protein